MTPEKASIILEYLLPQIEKEAQTTSRLLAAVPSEQADYKPSEKCMCARDLARHIAAADVWFLESVADGEFQTPDDTPLKEKSGAELATIYTSRIAAAVEKVRSVPAERLAAPMKFFVFEMPAIDLVQLMLKHSVHHRGQLSAYLRPMGAKLPKKRRLNSLFALLLLFAQTAGLPVPADQERQLLSRGYTERLMPVQADVLPASADDRKRGWLVYKRDRNFEVFPNSKPAPDEEAGKLTIVATPGETESQPFAIYAMRAASGLRTEVISNAEIGLRVEDVLFHPVQYPVARTRGRDEVRGSGAKTFVRYPV